MSEFVELCAAAVEAAGVAVIAGGRRLRADHGRWTWQPPLRASIP